MSPYNVLLGKHSGESFVQKLDHALSHANLYSAFPFSPPSPSLSFTIPSLWPTCVCVCGGGGHMLMRRSERRAGHGLNRHGKHTHMQTHTRLKAKPIGEWQTQELTSWETEKGKWEIKHLNAMYWLFIKASVSTCCPALNCQAVLCPPVPSSWKQPGMWAFSSYHSQLWTSQHKLKHSLALTLTAHLSPVCNQWLWRNIDLFNGNGIKSEWPSRGPLTQREEEERDGGVAEEW